MNILKKISNYDKLEKQTKKYKNSCDNQAIAIQYLVNKLISWANIAIQSMPEHQICNTCSGTGLTVQENKDTKDKIIETCLMCQGKGSMPKTNKEITH